MYVAFWTSVGSVLVAWFGWSSLNILFVSLLACLDDVLLSSCLLSPFDSPLCQSSFDLSSGLPSHFILILLQSSLLFSLLIGSCLVAFYSCFLWSVLSCLCQSSSVPSFSFGCLLIWTTLLLWSVSPVFVSSIWSVFLFSCLLSPLSFGQSSLLFVCYLLSFDWSVFSSGCPALSSGFLLIYFCSLLFWLVRLFSVLVFLLVYGFAHIHIHNGEYWQAHIYTITHTIWKSRMERVT